MRTTEVVLPLAPDAPKATRKARVAELHDLWLRAGCSDPVMLLLLDHRHGRRGKVDLAEAELQAAFKSAKPDRPSR